MLRSVNAIGLKSSHDCLLRRRTQGREELAGDTPDPVRGASPPAPPLYDWMSGFSHRTWTSSSDRQAKGEELCRSLLLVSTRTIFVFQRRAPSPAPTL